jgi:hypothetical protein
MAFEVDGGVEGGGVTVAGRPGAAVVAVMPAASVAGAMAASRLVAKGGVCAGDVSGACDAVAPASESITGPVALDSGAAIGVVSKKQPAVRATAEIAMCSRPLRRFIRQ